MPVRRLVRGIFVHEIKEALHGNIGWLRILSYLRFLDSAMLVRLLPPLELRLKRKKGNYKLCLCDHALRASWLGEKVPLDPEELARSPHLGGLAGHIAESESGFYLGSIRGLDLAHLPPRGPELEFDYLITVGEKRAPVEVKYRGVIDPHKRHDRSEGALGEDGL